ncbi:MAG: hypothetical protein GOVbin3695_38 [Prokaryotic dsDNA virus sp.]|nr:MAG: hypothetical protein GOVbin3695_38 [Prokaryotic dsDNA virus sp.]|tara:strand:+ start:12131 stop:12367 length:237 start_codon:yes stop_codon:yes gene_type:complete
MALSKTQNKRLGSILSVMFKEDVPNNILTDLIQGGYVKLVEKDYVLTDKGKDEKNRLCTLAGLNILYESEKKDIHKAN